jgi:hypothetical protein
MNFLLVNFRKTYFNSCIDNKKHKRIGQSFCSLKIKTKELIKLFLFYKPKHFYGYVTSQLLKGLMLKNIICIFDTVNWIHLSSPPSYYKEFMIHKPFFYFYCIVLQCMIFSQPNYIMDEIWKSCIMDDNQLCGSYLKWALKEVAQWMEI